MSMPNSQIHHDTSLYYYLYYELNKSNKRTHIIVAVLGGFLFLASAALITLSVLYYYEVNEACESSPGLPQPQTNRACVVGTSIQPDNYACKCPKGYSGNNCEEDLCSSHPCQNGDTCSIKKLPNDVGFTYFCQCPLQYIGTTCSEHRCDDFRCGYGACIMEGSTPTCQCAHGYEGEDCSKESCHCANGDCHRDMEGKPNCKCYTGFMGDKCNYGLPNDHSLLCRVDSTKQVVCTTINNANNLMCSIYTVMLSVFIALKLLRMANLFKIFMP